VLFVAQDEIRVSNTHGRTRDLLLHGDHVADGVVHVASLDCTLLVLEIYAKLDGLS
jgi:hypothetical protein